MLDNEASWEPVENLWQSEKLIEQFHVEDVMRPLLDYVGENVTDQPVN